MLLKCAAFFLAILSVQSATLQGKNIPVELKYKRLDHDITSNLAEKVQLSANDFKEKQVRWNKLNVAEENLLGPKIDHSNLIRNLAGKVNLFPEELLQSPKNIPIQHSIKESPDHDVDTLRSLPANLSNLSVEASDKASLILQAQEIIKKGLKQLRNNFSPKRDEIAPSPELWEKLEKDVEEYFLEQKNKLEARQETNQQHVLKNFTNHFEQLTDNFIQQFQGQNQTNQPVASGDKRTVNSPGDLFRVVVAAYLKYVASNIHNLGDKIFPAPHQGSHQNLSDSNTQGNTGTENPTGTQQEGFLSGPINQMNQAMSTIIPTSQATPVVQENESTETTGTIGTTDATGVNQGGPIRQVFQQIGNIGSAFNPFTQGGQRNNESQAPNHNFIQSFGENIGNAFQNIQNQFRPPAAGAPQKPAAGGDAAGSNPVVGQVSNVGNQLQQVAGQVSVRNLIPGGSSGTPAKVPAGEQSTAAAVAEDSPESKPEELPKREVMTATE